MKRLETAEKYYELMLKIVRELCVIPAPSGLEDERAKYCYDFLRNEGYDNVYIDEAKNVVWKIEGKDGEKTILFLGHTDTVFPDLKDIPLIEDETYIHSLGVSDDVAAVAQLLALSKYLKEINYKPKNTILFSANSCEEGLGDLKGTKKLFADYGKIIDRMYSLDGYYNHVANVSVGSKRFLVTARTEGGHSYGKFGNQNAISVLADIINKIYQIKVPVIEGVKTTYNVGTIEGGTSVNTIAQEAKMLCEYRSSGAEGMRIMSQKFDEIFAYGKSICPDLIVEIVGDRPGMNGVDEKEMEELTNKAIEVSKKYSGLDVVASSSSTDCNIPHSMGITAICLGNCMGKGAHTREEYLVKESLKPGFAIALEMIEYEGNR